jgi:GNAT superfamily N-acetyltransferase
VITSLLCVKSSAAVIDFVAKLFAEAMSTTSQSETTAALARGVTRRPEKTDDEPFLFEVYASTRREELALTSWDPQTQMAFLQMQFKAMRCGYAAQYPNAEFAILLLAGQPVGRMVIDRGQEYICLVDLTLLPQHRGLGIGSALMTDLLLEANRVGKPVQLHVFKHTRPVRWYERFGFVKTIDSGPYDQMEWQPERLSHRS